MPTRSGLKTRSSVLPFLIILLPWAAANAAAQGDVSVSLSDGGHGAYALVGSFDVVTDTKTAWDVLTDYDHLSDFVPSMNSSRVLQRDGAELLVEQRPIANILSFKKKLSMLLKISEEPEKEIDFEDVSHQNFDLYKGSWSLQQSKSGLLLTYRVIARGNFLMPDFIFKWACKKTAPSLLKAVRLEILRRSFGKTIAANKQ